MLEKINNSNSPLTDFQVNKPEEILLNGKEKSVEQQNQPQPQQQSQSKEKTEKVIHSMNDFLKASNTHLKFEFHDKLQKYYVTIIDDTTNEVIKEIPSKKLLDIYAAMTDYLGLLVDRKG